MGLLNLINSLKYKNEIDLLHTIYADGFVYSSPKTERIIYQMGSSDIRSFSRNSENNAFVGSIYPIHGDIFSIIKEDKFRVVTMNALYIVENMDVLNDNENARCYTFIAKNIIEKENHYGIIKLY